MSTQLSPIQRADQALGFVERKAELLTLVKQSERIADITNVPAYQECHAARMRLKNTRVEIEKAGKVAREDATAFSKAVIAKEKELVGVIEPEESRLQALQDAWDAARQAEKDAVAAKEKARLDAIKAGMDAIRNLPLLAVGKSVEKTQELLDGLRALDLSFAQEQIDSAQALQAETLDKLQAIHSERVAAEAEAERLAAERAELAKLRAEQEARLAEEAKQAAAARAEADRLAKLERDKEEAAMREKMAAEAAARAEAEAKVRAEREAAEAATRKEREAEQARMDAEAKRLREEAEALERERIEAARERLERELATVTLIEAATEAYDVLAESHPHHPATLKLAAALTRELENAA